MRHLLNVYKHVCYLLNGEVKNKVDLRKKERKASLIYLGKQCSQCYRFLLCLFVCPKCAASLAKPGYYDEQSSLDTYYLICILILIVFICRTLITRTKPINFGLFDKTIED